ncbi:lipid-A-disaccharide synthase [Geobacter sulfurreducens]|uniref:Lipid-A-disaccharide synthase n=1 Tax=Geobacter sulfurreducens (strain ATCC 51573 / DSM 12127 / PCA) TaxID=243231 RepID=LPXB_GEOSL|nr:lipid-A-disaccharide synthase [Geobacter sulfurreducens]Q74AT9.1 RecName: Full=Lipid-A-disaccharide synthase [Geobacter sulfurreducens PCA]AAR35637.1 lipid A disaccharide synthase [Geobacter sulfurreducens PCA]ADI85019.2 lipid A disaccharide synthase [Geobacter sulfurreducens KN400]QVW34114.1 lipid-A-disaccharide synthase [Geobacter sulfurreducens]UAC02975.1 lipid-A-disaccharide synthase [Geobacter sulfurreducens]UTG91622.1 lipid-A-disaccharide synthase [Geobacter sulfurreducens]
MTENTSHRIMIVAGEASGDLHGAGLVREALRLDPTLSFFGIGGPRMREAGVETLVDSSEMAVVGIVEVLAHIGVISRAFMTLRQVIVSNPPDLLILIDYPDFNMLLARVARRHGVKVLYYISPQVWAWRTGRVKTIGRLVDRMAVVFPFEVPFYERAGVPVSFVGHPLADRVRPTMGRDEALASFGLDPGRRVVGLFPGSRRGEIAKLFPVILESAQQLRERYPDIQFILPLASSLTDGDIAPLLAASGLDVTVTQDRVYDVMQVCDAIITVSGTVTLEIALMGVPMVIIYKVSPLTYQVGKRLIRVDHIGICNIVAGERVVPELIQDDASADRIAAEIGRYLDDPAYAEKTRAGLAMVKEKLGTGGCSERVAGIVLEMLGKQV